MENAIRGQQYEQIIVIDIKTVKRLPVVKIITKRCASTNEIGRGTVSPYH